MNNYTLITNQSTLQSLDKLIDATIASGIKNFELYFSNSSLLPETLTHIFDSIFNHFQQAPYYCAYPSRFKKKQDILFQKIYHQNYNFSIKEKLFFEFLLGLSRYYNALLLTLDFFQFIKKSYPRMLGDSEHDELVTCQCLYCQQQHIFWRPLHHAASMANYVMSIIRGASNNFSSIDYWELVQIFFKNNPKHKILAKYLVSMHYIPRDKQLISLSQVLHWGGFGGQGQFLKSYRQFKPLLEYSIHYHKKAACLSHKEDIFEHLLRVLQNKMTEITVDIFEKYFSNKSLIRVFDVGAGPNYLAAQPIINCAIQSGCDVELTASDIAPKSLKALLKKQRYNDSHLKAVYYLDLYLLDEIQLNNNTYCAQFDIITVNLVLHQLDHQQIFRALSFFAKLMKPGGIILNADVGRHNYYQCLIAAANVVDREGYIPDYKQHVFCYDEPNLDSLHENIKIAYPLRQYSKYLPSQEIQMYRTAVYIVIPISYEQLQDLKNLWKEGQVDAADKLAFRCLEGTKPNA